MRKSLQKTEPGGRNAARAVRCHGNIRLTVHKREWLQNEELRHTQQELETSRDRYSTLYDFAPVGYLTLDRDGVILDANLTAGQLLGSARGALLRQRLTDFIVPADQDTSEWS